MLQIGIEIINRLTAVLHSTYVYTSICNWLYEAPYTIASIIFLIYIYASIILSDSPTAYFVLE